MCYTYADAPKGQEISAPHAAKRNVGLKTYRQGYPERMTGYIVLSELP
ncbi:hypothetical protein Barb6XT_02507 [Bacteroidales bacterium Barb6XT]|nr:hypothetical protein Barb6XT_02507 [Bacteroidales bacterium Barb6XT]